MVRFIVLASVLGTVASSASAQAVDWRRAGGDLFGGGAVEAASDMSPVEAEPARLRALSQPFQEAIDAAALAHGLDPKLLHALVVTESAYRADAVSPAGAGGLTQLMPGTAFDLGVRDRFDPIENLRGGADYLARQIVRFGDLRLALAAYNAGPARVARLGRVPDIAETRAYVVTVIDCYLALAAARGVLNSRQCQPSEPTP
ncbi:lytic transglycosylase domain-containing protein [Brevundimonas sp.]|uniref:lytic transglycosylase domain-containing protein n=1 Tax=Brevundimonas sp. TaxID=1871086 RepID=UPI003BA8B2B5